MSLIYFKLDEDVASALISMNADGPIRVGEIQTNSKIHEDGTVVQVIYGLN